jgi:hypothetical protein
MENRIRLTASSFSPRLVVLLKAQAVPRRLHRPVLAHRFSWLRKHTRVRREIGHEVKE